MFNLNVQNVIQFMKMRNMTPQQFMLQMYGQQNPVAMNVINMLNNNDQKAVEEFTKNLCNSRGIQNYDELYGQFKQQFR